MKKFNVNQVSTTLSTGALLTDKVLAYWIPLKDVSLHTLWSDIRKVLAALVGKDYEENISVRFQTRYSRTSDLPAIRLETNLYSVSPSKRVAKKYRVVSFDKDGNLDLQSLAEAADEVIRLNKEIVKVATERHKAREAEEKLKLSTCRFLGITESRYGNYKRGKTVVDFFEMDKARDDNNRIKLDLIGTPKKLKKAIKVLAELGVTRGNLRRAR